jgi:hypothetical protein
MTTSTRPTFPVAAGNENQVGNCQQTEKAPDSLVLADKRSSFFLQAHQADRAGISVI